MSKVLDVFEKFCRFWTATKGYHSHKIKENPETLIEQNNKLSNCQSHVTSFTPMILYCNKSRDDSCYLHGIGLLVRSTVHVVVRKLVSGGRWQLVGCLSGEYHSVDLSCLCSPAR